MSSLFTTEASPSPLLPSAPVRVVCAEFSLRGSRPATILIVDDDECCRRTLRRMLERQHHIVSEAQDGSVALVALQACMPDLMFLDMMMPGTDGLEVLKEMRQRGIRIPVVGMSGGSFASSVTLRFSERLGAFYTLLKPFSGDEALLAVGMALGRGPV